MQKKETVAFFRMQIERYLKENFPEKFCLGSFCIEHFGRLRVTAVYRQTRITVWYDRNNDEYRDSRLKKLLPEYASSAMTTINEMWSCAFYELNTVYLFGRPNAPWDKSLGLIENAERQKARLVVRMYIREEQLSKADEAQKIEIALEELQCCVPQVEISFRYVSESDWQGGRKAKQSGKNCEIPISNCEAFYYTQFSKGKALPSKRMIEEAMEKWKM